jgi:hypothetical protein
LKFNGIQLAEAELVAIIRRLDKDCDARLGFEELRDGFTPS